MGKERKGKERKGKQGEGSRGGREHPLSRARNEHLYVCTRLWRIIQIHLFFGGGFIERSNGQDVCMYINPLYYTACYYCYC